MTTKGMLGEALGKIVSSYRDGRTKACAQALVKVVEIVDQLEAERDAALAAPSHARTPMLDDDRIMAWVRILRVANDGRDYKEHITPMDVEACVRGALKEQAALSSVAAPCSKCGKTPPFPGGTRCQDMQCPLIDWAASSTREPVAWRWRRAQGGPQRFWAYAEDRPNGPGVGDCEIEPLFSASAIESSAPSVLPTLPGHKALTVVMVKDDGDVQADAAIAAIQRGDTFLLTSGVSELFLHQLRLRVALDPSLADKIAVYYLIPGERRYEAVSLTNTLKWPVGFLQHGWEKEAQISAAKCGDDANSIAVKMRDKLRATYASVDGAANTKKRPSHGTRGGPEGEGP